MPLHKVSELAAKGDRKAVLAQQKFGTKYDEHYMQRTLPDDEDEDDEAIVVDEDAPGLRRTVDILCISEGFLGVKPLPSSCDVIIIDGDVFVAGEAEFLDKFTPV